MKTAVEFISFDDDIVALVAEDIVRPVVLGDASQEGVTAHMALVHDVCTHRGGRCLAMGSRYTEPFMGAGKSP